MRSLVVFAAVYAAVGFLPLFGGPGYESALALGLLAPLPLSVMCALATRHKLAGADCLARCLPSQLLDCQVRALKWVAVSLVIVCLHGLRVGFCDAVDGLLLLLLGPICGCFMAAAGGMVAGGVGLRSNAWVTGAIAALGPLLGLALSAWRFASSPMVFAFDPFVGYFAGTLYDTVIVAIPRLLTYRAGSLSSLLALASACALLQEWQGARGGVQEGNVAVRISRRGMFYAGVSGLALAGSLSIWWWGPKLGHYQSTESIRSTLGQKAEGERCEVVHGRGVSTSRARLLVRECEAHLAAHEAFFDSRKTPKVTVFAFDSSTQKGALMGASRTYIAKPWRYEVYIQPGGYPHPVLGHELAHVVAGNLARGPFLVAGPLGGWIPDPGRIEGFAVAAAPAEDTQYGLMTWARALKSIGALPALSTLFRLSFLGQNSSKAYTVAGAYVGFLHKEYGASALRTWYSGGSLSDATGGVSDEQLEAQFLAALDALPPNLAAEQAARDRFARPAIFARRCPHDVDRVLSEAAGAYSRADWPRATKLYQIASKLDPVSLSGRLGLIGCRRRAGDLPGAISDLENLLQDPTLISRQIDSVQWRLGDRLLQAGRLSEAQALFEQLQGRTYNEHQRRALEVRRFATQGIGSQKIIAFLLGNAQSGVERMSASAGLGIWSAREPARGLADYLLAKNLFVAERWQAAEFHLQRSLARPVGLLSVRREALRIGVYLACAQQHWILAEERAGQYLELAGGSQARRHGVERQLKRCLSAR